jgi:type IV secretory pathway VirB10-like protein
MAMRKSFHLAICLLAAPAVLASGCGSTKTASTNSATTTSASASAPTDQSTPTVPPSTSAKPARPAGKAHEPKVAQANPEQKQKAAEAAAGQKEKAARVERERKEKAAEDESVRRLRAKVEAQRRAAARPGLEAVEARLPLKRRYPKVLQGKFLVSCKAAKGSRSSCECIIAKQELNLKLEKGQTLAELLALEIAFEKEGASLEDIRRHRAPSPRGVRKVTQECK